MQGRKTGGRLAGTPNKATAGMKAAARRYGAKAVERLAWLMEQRLGRVVPGGRWPRGSHFHRIVLGNKYANAERVRLNNLDWAELG